MIKSTTIDADNKKRSFWSELWNYRELFQVLALRDVSVRYKQTIVGIAWAIIRPVVTMAVFTIIFGKVANLEDTVSMPYILLVYAGVLPWQFFSSALGDASQSVVGNSNLVSKVYFPRLIVPTSSLLVSLIDMAISFCLYVSLMVYFGVTIRIEVLFLPLILLLLLITTLGPVLLLSSLNVRYRDIKYIIPFIIQVGVFISPVGFSTDNVASSYSLLYYLNPLASVIDLFRWSLLGIDFAHSYLFIFLGTAVSLTIFILGMTIFRRMESRFADEL